MCVVDCGIIQKTTPVQIAGVCYRDAAGVFWPRTFQDSTGEDAEFAAGLHAKHIAARNGLPNDGRVVKVRFVEVEGKSP